MLFINITLVTFLVILEIEKNLQKIIVKQYLEELEIAL